MKKLLLAVACALSVSSLAYGQETLRVYTAFEADQLSRYKQAFEKVHPDIEIQWVRDSTGIITAKLLAEKDHPQADVIWGLAASSLVVLNNENMLEPYAPLGLERLDKRFYDQLTPPAWVGFDGWGGAICVKTVELKNKHLPMPETWEDLTKPIYKGLIRMPNPASSGTGFLAISSWLQQMGEEKAWQFMDGLNENIDIYTHSGSKPCNDVARGEAIIGISLPYRGAQLIGQGAPLAIVVPESGIGWDAEAAAIVKGTDKQAAAQQLMNFAISDEAMRQYNEGFAILAIPSMAKSVENYPDTVKDRLIDNDFSWAAEHRERILDHWEKSYGSKSEPKS